jgi:hypothetical protein
MPRKVCGIAQQEKEYPMTTKPSLLAYTVKDRGKKQKAIWTRIGAAWPHNTGNGFSIELEALPVDGRLVLIEPKAEAAEVPAADSFEAEGGDE